MPEPEPGNFGQFRPVCSPRHAASVQIRDPRSRNRSTVDSFYNAQSMASASVIKSWRIAAVSTLAVM